MEAVPELPEIKSEIKAEDFINSVNNAHQVTENNHSPQHHANQAASTPGLVDHQLQNAACGWVGTYFCYLKVICENITSL